MGTEGEVVAGREEEEEEEIGKRRIFVGGLGGSVTAEDLEKTFCSLGRVKGIDIIRSNGRSFAYMDFEPSSLKSLSKLFSTYNGCIWKGGRLRLENAKDHYLVRLKREWQEDAQLAHKTSNADHHMDTSQHPNLLPPLDKTQLRIFFPRLRKVKSVPYSGTGKHKYSFQRVQVPSFPIHFCDCEEHCGAHEAPKEKPIIAPEDQTAPVNEDEINMMTSVMNSIFQRSVNSTTENSGSRVATQGGESKQSIDDIPCTGTEVDQEPDSDNLVINMVSGGSSKFGLVESRAMAAINQELRKHQPSNVDPCQNKTKAQKGKNIEPLNASDTTSKNHHLTTLVNNKDECTSRKAQKRKHLETCPEESKGVKEAKFLDQKKSMHHSTTGPFWRQKSSWKDLVGETTTSSFNISQILKDTNTKPTLQKSNGLETPCFTESIEHELNKPKSRNSAGDCFEPLEVGNDEMVQDNVIMQNASTVTTTGIPSKESDIPKEAEKHDMKASGHQASRGHFWLQKSSWRELVEDSANNSFSISHVLPGITTMRQNLPKSNTLGTEKAIDSKQQNSTNQFRSEPSENSSKDHNIRKGRSLPEKATASGGSAMISLVNEEEVLGGLQDGCNPVDKYTDEKNDKPSETKTTSASNDRRAGLEAGFGEFCSFMRSSASQKEWMKTRAALSGTLKKKTSEK